MSGEFRQRVLARFRERSAEDKLELASLPRWAWLRRYRLIRADLEELIRVLDSGPVE